MGPDSRTWSLRQGKEGIKGRHWFTEPDLKAGACIRSDKTGRALLTVLRHLGRIQEVRLPAC